MCSPAPRKVLSIAPPGSGPAGAAALLALLLLAGRGPGSTDAADRGEQGEPYRSPIHVCLSLDGETAYVVNQGSHSVSVLDLLARRVVAEITVGPHPSCAALDPDGRTLYVSSSHGNVVEVVDLEKKRVVRSIGTGFEPYGVSVSADGTRLHVVNSIAGSVSTVELPVGRTVSEIPVGREPRYAAETPDGARLVVANGLSRSVSIIDLASACVVETRDLGRASILRGVVCSRDGRWAFVAHVVSHDEVFPLQIERGWVHSNGFSVLDLTRPGHRVTLLLDRLMAGASNPWGLSLSSDGRELYVSLSGVHEVAIIDVAEALRLVAETGPERVKDLEEDVEIVEMRKIARRVKAAGLGPRGLAVNEVLDELLVANYFSDAVSVLDRATGELRATIPLGPPKELTPWRRGELLFNDARLTYQGWFSCASCHQEDATIDGLNWDLANDGLGTPKNVKSLHDVHDTPPAMWSGVRKDMDAAVAAGQRFGGFLPEPESHRALMAFLAAPRRAPNPYRQENPETLARGKQAFSKAGCRRCHPPPLFADLRKHRLDLDDSCHPDRRIDTPSLREVYRTAPYLHDGRAQTLAEIFTRHDPGGVHGRIERLTDQEFCDLMSYVRSL